jgi:hypothetical protein
MDLDKRQESLHEMIQALSEDLLKSQKQMRRHRTNFWRRAFVRSALSYVDGVCSTIKHKTLLAETHKLPDEIRVGQLAALLGETYLVTEGGEVRAREFIIPAKHSIAFCLRSYAEALGADFKLDRSSSGWAALLKAVDVRNRITHPKHLADIEVSHDELDTISIGVRWFGDRVSEISKKATRFRGGG